MLEREKVVVDILDIFITAKKELSFASLLFQLKAIYEPQGIDVDQELILDILSELTSKGYLKTFKVGILDSWKITDEGEDYFYEL